MVEQLVTEFFNGARTLETLRSLDAPVAESPDLVERVSAFEKAYAELVDLHGAGKLAVGEADFSRENLERVRRLAILVRSSGNEANHASEIQALAGQIMDSLKASGKKVSD